MATLSYAGRTPDTDSAVCPKSYADTLNSTLQVTTGYVSTQISSAAATLTTQTYVDSQNALLAKQAAVTAADSTFLPVTSLNVASGVAGLSSSGNIITGQLPTSGIITDRVMQCYSIGSASGQAGLLGGTLGTVTNATGLILINGSHTVSTSNVREFQLASLELPDPGYPWVPLCYGLVQGDSSGGTAPAYRQEGNGDFGLITVLPPLAVSNQVYGTAVCTGSIKTNTYPITPFAAPNQTALTVTPITGPLELDVWGCCFSGTSYTFYEANFTFFILQVASM
jgi:hypothetical protein